MRPQFLCVVMICIGGPVWAESVAVKLLPARTDIILTLNTRELLKDYCTIPSVERYLDQWRFAANGGTQRLLEYYDVQEVQKFEGITLKEFLDRSSMITAACNALGCDPFEDIDLITVGYAAGDEGYMTVIVEGRFKQRNTESLAQFFQQHLFPMNEGDGPSLEMLDSNTCVFADRRKTMELIRARAVEMKGEMPGGIPTLLESGRKKHFSIVVNNLQANVERLLRFVGDELTGPLAVDPQISEFVVEQGRQRIQKFVIDYSACSFGLSIKSDERQLEFGLDAKNAEKVESLRAMINVGTFLLTEVLKSVDHELARALAAILAKQRVFVKETTMIAQFDVPNKFVAQALNDPSLDVFPDSKKANANKKPLPSHEEIQNVSWRVTSIPIWTSGVSAAEFEEVRDQAYKTGQEADPFRHRLDMYLPRDKKDFPVLVLVHGGGWDQGDNRCAGLYSSIGQFLASQGIGVVMPNYRLSPSVKHPEHIKDVASAVAWTRTHAGSYGGDVRRLYLLGHSAGGHLVSLLATDESYLKAEGMSSADIKGVITVSGVYHITEGTTFGVLLGAGPRALRFEQQFPLRGESGPSWKWNPPGWHVTANIFGSAFGDSGKVRADASPITHVRRDLPPFLIVTAENDLPLLGSMADEFHTALREKGCDATRLRVPHRNHNSVMFSAITPQEPAAQAILEFVRK